MVDNVSHIARLVSRVLMVAKQEADNSEDPNFVAQVKGASSKLEFGEREMFIYSLYSLFVRTCEDFP